MVCYNLPDTLYLSFNKCFNRTIGEWNDIEINLLEALRADSMVFWISDFDWSQIDQGLSPATSASMTPFSMTASKKFRNIGAWQSATYRLFIRHTYGMLRFRQKSIFDPR